MVWRDYAAMIALAVILLGNKLKTSESESLEWIGMIMVSFGAIAVAALWPRGIV